MSFQTEFLTLATLNAIALCLLVFGTLGWLELLKSVFDGFWDRLR